MPNIASILKAEISRVARKEVRTEIESLKKASAQHRSTIAALRRQVVDLEKQLRRLSRSPQQGRSQSDAESDEDAGPQRRFSATRLAAHRTKLGLSAAAYGQLVGVAGQSVYNWEQGKSRPRREQIEKLAAVRVLTRRTALEQLGEAVD